MLLYFLNNSKKSSVPHPHIVVCRYEDYEGTLDFLPIVDYCTLVEDLSGGFARRSEIRELDFCAPDSVDPMLYSNREEIETALGRADEHLRRNIDTVRGLYELRYGKE